MLASTTWKFHETHNYEGPASGGMQICNGIILFSNIPPWNEQLFSKLIHLFLFRSTSAHVLKAEYNFKLTGNRMENTGRMPLILLISSLFIQTPPALLFLYRFAPPWIIWSDAKEEGLKVHHEIPPDILHLLCLVLSQQYSLSKICWSCFRGKTVWVGLF